ncbi:MAG: LysR family transcriptional regulator [Clostridiales Family XIII bacterium]|jgi:DNA-binding transcriptional LysR family regulator|nr:LysR family transcriptional regulator [Clostridiales Family XIII bacterium]
MNIHKLNVFVTSAQYLSFTEAARQLHIAQPSVSHDIAELEKELGTKLFARTNKGIVLTPQGEIFLTETCKILTIMQSTKQKIETMTGGESGELKFGFISEQMTEPVMPFLRYFRETHPAVNITFNSYTSIALTRRIQSSEVDLAFGRRESLVRHEDTDWLHLYKDPFCFVLPGSHPLAARKKLRLSDVAGETIILMSSDANPGFFEIIQRLYLSHGITPLINATTNDRLATLMMVRIGMGITILTKQFVSVYDLSELSCIPIAEDDALHDVGLAWDKRITNPMVEMFRKALGEYLVGHPILL